MQVCGRRVLLRLHDLQPKKAVWILHPRRVELAYEPEPTPGSRSGEQPAAVGSRQQALQRARAAGKCGLPRAELVEIREGTSTIVAESPKEKTVNERQWAAIDRSGLSEKGRCTRRTHGSEFSEAYTVFPSTWLDPRRGPLRDRLRLCGRLGSA